MTRIVVQRGSGSSSNRGGSSSASRPETQAPGAPLVTSTAKDEEVGEKMEEQVVADENETIETKPRKSDENVMEINGFGEEIGDGTKLGKDDDVGSGSSMKGLDGLRITERSANDIEGSPEFAIGNHQPPPPPVPPPKPLTTSSNSRRPMLGVSNSVRVGPTRRAVGWPVVSTRSSPSASRPSSPRSHVESEGYNSADEQSTCFASSYDDYLERERQFENDIRRAKGLEVKRMLEDGNCLFRAVADQVYGDSDAYYDLIRQNCIDYMEKERDHFSQFVTEGFTSYCKRKRRDKVHGNNVEIQAMSEMYNRPIHIFSYSTEPINIFHGSYNTDMPPIRLSYHRGNHYNSLFDPRRLSIGVGLGFSSLRGANVDRDQVKAAIKAQQDQQIEKALLAEGQLYSDLELTEKEIERMTMEASRAEYLGTDKLKQQFGHKESSTSGAEPSSSAARSPGKEAKTEGGALSSSIQMLLSMGFSYLQAIEAYSIFGDDVDSMVCYLVETASSSRRKGKATE